MKTRDVMNGRPHTVRSHDPLSDAARVMQECASGWVPVVDDGARVVGIITDRDICMAALTRGMLLSAMAVEGAMSTNVHGVHPDDPLENALALMRNHRVRRLPVVDEDGALVGLLSLTDLVRRAAAREGGVHSEDVVATLAAICEPRSAETAI